MTASSPPQSDVPIKDQLKRRRRPLESGVIASLFIAGVISIGITVGILYELVRESLLFFQDDRVSFVEFFTTTVWQPQAGSFGIWPLILGTLLITVIALIVAVPIGLAAAIYLSEYASTRVRNIFKPVLEILVGIPTVVFGFFAITFMTPLLRSIFGTSTVGFFNVLSAGIVVGILIVPLVSSLSEDAMSAVPDSLRQAAYGLGRVETRSIASHHRAGSPLGYRSRHRDRDVPGDRRDHGRHARGRRLPEELRHRFRRHLVPAQPVPGCPDDDRLRGDHRFR